MLNSPGLFARHPGRRVRPRGDGLVRPLNAPPAQQLSPGVQPGVQQPVVIAVKVIIYGPNGGEFIYSGAPAAGNLIFSNTGSAGSDPYKNNYLSGSTWYNNSSGIAFNIYPEAAATADNSAWYTFTPNPGAVFTFAAGFGAWDPPAGLAGMFLQYSLSLVGDGGTNPGILFLYDAGSTEYAQVYADSTSNPVNKNSQDGNSYKLGHLVLPATAVPQTISSTSATTITGCSANAAAGSYRIRVVLQFTANAAAGNPSFQIGVSGTLTEQWGNAIIWQSTGTGAGANRFVVDTSGMLFQGPGMVSAATYLVQIDAFAKFSTTGGISLQAFTSATADTFEVNNAFMELLPV